MASETGDESFEVPSEPARLWGLAAASLAVAVVAFVVAAYTVREGAVGGAIQGGAIAGVVAGLLSAWGWASVARAGRPLVVVRPDGIEDNASIAGVGFVPRASLGAPSIRRRVLYRFLVIPATSPEAAAVAYDRLSPFKRFLARRNRRFGLVVIPGTAVADLDGLKSRIEALWRT